jgi:hypothetical protein
MGFVERMAARFDVVKVSYRHIAIQAPVERARAKGRRAPSGRLLSQRELDEVEFEEDDDNEEEEKKWGKRKRESEEEEDQGVKGETRKKKKRNKAGRA